MKKITLALTIIFAGYFMYTQSQITKPVKVNKAKTFKPAKVDFDAFEKLSAEAKIHRKTRLVDLDKFLAMSKKENTIILDTRSDKFYYAKSIKGAVHLNFSDFTQRNLSSLIPNQNTTILIYCNNNFDDDEVNFATKKYIPSTAEKKPITLALNIPTYINLYGYGYKNVYELSELVSVKDKRIQFEGNSVK